MTPEEFIIESQRGKSGIYPYRLAMDVAFRFGISPDEARKLVLEHIAEELRKAMGITLDKCVKA